MKIETKKYTLEIWYIDHWKEGIKFYDTLEEANKRIEDLAKIGIKARLNNRKENEKW